MSNDEHVRKSITTDVEECLEIVYKLSCNGEMVKINKISKNLNVSPRKITPIFKNLDDMGYVNYSPHNGVKLTETGLNVAQRITQRRKLPAKFVHDVLKFKDRSTQEPYYELDSSSDETERSPDPILEYSNECPDDKVITAHDALITSREDHMVPGKVSEIGIKNGNLIPIVSLKNNQEGKVSFIRGNYKVMRRLLDMGVTIGAFISVIKVAPLGGPVEVAVRGSKLAIGRDIARNVFVEAYEEGNMNI